MHWVEGFDSRWRWQVAKGKSVTVSREGGEGGECRRGHRACLCSRLIYTVGLSDRPGVGSRPTVVHPEADEPARSSPRLIRMAHRHVVKPLSLNIGESGALCSPRVRARQWIRTMTKTMPWQIAFGVCCGVCYRYGNENVGNTLLLAAHNQRCGSSICTEHGAGWTGAAKEALRRAPCCGFSRRVV